MRRGLILNSIELKVNRECFLSDLSRDVLSLETFFIYV